MATESTGPRVFLFPWLAYGHISAFLELAKKLAERGSYVYLCSTPVNLKSIDKKVRQIDTPLNIQRVELHLPSLPELPPSRHTTNGLPRQLIPTLVRTLKMAKQNLSDTIGSLNPDLVIHDFLMPWVASVAVSHNIPAAGFNPTGIVGYSYIQHVLHDPETEFPSSHVFLREFEKAGLDKFLGFMSLQREGEDEVPGPSSTIILIKTSRDIDGKYIDYASKFSRTETILPVGPLVEDPPSDHQNDDSIELIRWLGKKKEHSTVFVSFGSEYYPKKEEIKEIAFGLELSQVNFIWVIRFPEGENMSAQKALPEGFLDRTADRGKVVEGWVPQSRILNHPSIGGFVSHCGWNSTLESLVYGVPLIAMPMHLEQPLNARLMVEMGVAIEVVRDDNGSLGRQEIAKVVKDAIVGHTGKKLREQVTSVAQKVKTRETEEMDEAYHQLLALVNSGHPNVV